MERVLGKRVEEKSARLHDFYYSPGSRSLHIVFASDDPLKAFEGCALTLQKHGLKLLGASFTSRDIEGDDWSLMVENSVGLEAKAVRKELLSVKGMRYVLVNEDDDGMIVDKVHFPPLDPGGERAYVISVETLGKMFEKVRQLFGTGGEVLIYEQGEMVGAREVEEMSKIFGRENIVPHLPQLPYLFQVTGVGKPEVVSLNLETLEVVFRIHRSAECEGRKSSVPYSRWIKGQLVGFMSTLFETPCKAEETKCIAMGDAYCEFKIKPS